MNKHLLLSGLLMLCVSMASAQKKPKDPKFGEVEAWEWALSDFKGDTTVGAIEIFDIGKHEFDINTYDFFYTRHQRIKILKSAAADEYGNVIVPYVPEIERFSKIRAHALERNDQGEVVKYELESRDIVDERITRDKRSAYFRAKRFSIPNIKPGCIVEITYTKNTGFITPPDWNFQAKHPKLSSRFVFTYPAAFIYSEAFKGPRAGQQVRVKSESAGSMRFGANTYSVFTKTFSADSVQAFGDHKFIYAEEDHIMGLQIDVVDTRESFGPNSYIKNSWFKISRDLQKDKLGFNEEELREPSVIELANRLKNADTVQTIRNVYQYLTREVATIKSTDKENTRESSSLKDVIKNKSASLRMKVALGLRLFSVMGYSPAMLFIRDRDAGLIRKANPDLFQFQHRVLFVATKDNDYLLDLEENFHPFGVLPKGYYNREAWLVTKDVDVFVPMEMPIGEEETITINGKLSPKGELTGAFTLRLSGYAAIDTRSRWREKGTHYWANKELFDEPNLIKVERFAVDTTVAVEEPAVVTGEFVKADFAQDVDGELYFNPMLIDREQENPLKEETREFPIEFDSRFTHQYLLNLDLPTGFSVAELPKPVRIILPDKSMEFTRAVGVQDGRLTISIRFINRREVYPAPVYGGVRKIYETVVSAMAEQIILKPTK